MFLMSKKPSYEALEKKVAELEESQLFFENLLDMLPELVSYIDRNHLFKFGNKSYQQFFNINPESITGLHPREILGDEAFQKVEPHHIAALSGQEQEYESTINLPNGMPLYFHAHYLPHKVNGQVNGFLAVIIDITRLKQNEEKLRNNEKRFNLSAESGEIGLWELDLIGHTAWRSLKHDQIFGYEALLSEWTYEMFLEHVITEDRPMVDQKLGKALGERCTWDFECRIKRKDGAIRWIWARGNSEKDEKQQPIKMLGTIQDITERRQIEMERENILNSLQKAFEEIKTLKGIIPICAECKKIRDDKGYWNQLESYIQKHSGASFSHGMCPECSDKLYGDHDWYKDMKKKKGCE